MQLILFYNVVYVYVCKIGEEKFDVLLFQSADRSWVVIGCKNQDGPVHGVGDLARFSHFKTTF